MSTSNYSTPRICYFGDYDIEYNRTKMLIEGLRLQDVDVKHCRTTIRSKMRYVDLWKQFRAIRSQCDVVILGFSDDRLMPIAARLIAWGKIIIWDSQFSFYDNWVFDRKLVKPGSLKAGYHWFLDWINCRMADILILDFNKHIQYFHETFGVSPSRCIRVNGSADVAVFFPRPHPPADGFFRVEYHGKYIPVQGTDVIVRAAKILEDDSSVKFTMIGDGQEYKKTRKLADDLGLTNIEFLPFLPLASLPPYIAAADVCIGLIGDVPRVARTVPNKLYEAAAMGRVAINANVPAIREIFTDEVDVVLIKQGNAEELANKILMLKNNPQLVEKISHGAYLTFQKKCSPKSIGLQLIEGMQQILGV